MENPTFGESPMYGEIQFISQQEWYLAKFGDTSLHGLHCHVVSIRKDALACRFESRGMGKLGKPHAQCHGVPTYARLSEIAGADESLFGVCMELPSTLF